MKRAAWTTWLVSNLSKMIETGEREPEVTGTDRKHSAHGWSLTGQLFNSRLCDQICENI